MSISIPIGILNHPFLLPSLLKYLHMHQYCGDHPKTCILTLPIVYLWNVYDTQALRWVEGVYGVDVPLYVLFMYLLMTLLRPKIGAKVAT